MNQVHSVEIVYKNGERVYINEIELEKMEKAADAIDMLNKAKSIALRMMGHEPQRTK